MKRLTSKDVKIGVKNGFTVRDFCAKFSLRNEEAFFEQLKEAYPHGGYDQILREIRNNEKRGKKVSGHPHQKGGIRMGKMKLEVLKAQEAGLKSAAAKLDEEYENLENQYQACTDKAYNLQKQVNKLYVELKNCRSQLNQTRDRFGKIEQQMQVVSADREKNLASLNSIRAEIESLTIVSIGVHGNCELEVMEGNIVLDLSGKEGELNALTHKLADQEICENLTIKQVRTLAKLLIITSADNRKIKFIFDNSDLEAAYLASCPRSLSS